MRPSTLTANCPQLMALYLPVLPDLFLIARFLHRLHLVGALPACRGDACACAQLRGKVQPSKLLSRLSLPE